MEYPYEEGDTVVIGPGCFASRDRKVLSWQGENYVPQRRGAPCWVAVFLTLLLGLAVGAAVGATSAQASNASCAQYGGCPPSPPGELPMTGYLLIPLVGIGLVLLAVGLVLRERTR